MSESAGVIQSIQNAFNQLCAAIKQDIGDDLREEAVEFRKEMVEFREDWEEAKIVRITTTDVAITLFIVLMLIYATKHYRTRYGWLFGARPANGETDTPPEYVSLVDEKKAGHVPGEYPPEKV